MASRPQNHVIRELEARARMVNGEGVPIIRNLDDLVAYLGGRFPPRCRKPDETEREHERFAGKVELVEYIKRIVEQNRREDLSDGDLPANDFEHVGG